jgi:hypothetical protein
MADHPMNFAADERSLERDITRVLERAPEIHIPDGFAARVANQMPPVPAATLTPTRYGRKMGIVCMAVLMVILLVFAHHLASPSLLWTSLECILSVQFVGLAFWLVAGKLGPVFHWRMTG